ncbi:hypothetical protein HRW14_01800 [Streptomyces lunaelactis]|uniref:hypothetical protein n=1 Tax=Streptomyces lunaelactis TaxID=1535768 RepID=UPI001585D13E|nr:hypothetical protein [Streptomyces lunaelactis]NUK22614.1 hypothetical protein [Streptomyces lunaelactis]NUK49055.1 hypothetical protein [Streptomyces lunaelactis]NUK62858.1 hypothetical protein [Streptomyces lunaelactis]
MPQPLVRPAFNVTVVVPEAGSAEDILRVVSEAGCTECELVMVGDLLQAGRVPAARIPLTVRAKFACADADSVRAEACRRSEAVLRALGDG